MNTMWQRVRGDERGSAATELSLLTPILILLLLFVVFCGRLADARLRMNDAAHQAARAATLARSSPQATADAQTTTAEALGQAGVSCRNLTVTTNTEGLQPGSTVVVTVHCEIDLSDLSLLGVPGSTTASASASSVVDQWRGEALGFRSSEAKPAVAAGGVGS